MNDTTLGGLGQILELFKPATIILLILGVIVLSFVVRFLRRTGEQLAHRFPARRLLILQIINVVAFTVYTAGSLILFFSVLAPPRELMVAVAGGLAVAVGLALKDIVSSLMAGIILLFDRPFNVGDRVQFQNYYGEITAIGLRAVRLQTLTDDTVTIPNSVFVTESVASGNFGELTMMVSVNLYVAPASDLQKAQELAHEAVVTSRYSYVRKPVTIVMQQQLSANLQATVITVKAYVCDVKYEKAFATDILMRCTNAYREAGIAWAA